MNEDAKQVTDDNILTQAGTPPCINDLVEALATEGKQRRELWARLNAALPPGADTGGIPSILVIRLLNDKLIAPFANRDEAVLAARDSVNVLHQRVGLGLFVGRKEWTLARSAAVTAADAAEGKARATASIVEAAAWSPATSRTLLTDVVRCWKAARDLVLREDEPWTAEMEARAQATLAKIAKDNRAAIEDGKRVNFAELFAAHDPDLERGFRSNIERYQQRNLALSREVADMLVDAFAAAPEDPYLWLEEVDGDNALDQVRAWNAATDAKVRSRPEFAELEARARAFMDDTRRIAMPMLFDGCVYNFWSDADHLRGVWRRSPEAAYIAGAPEWEVLIDVDALGREESANWVWHGATLLRPAGDRCMVSLSDGGRDAVVWREFDLKTRRFITDGFYLPEGKTRLTWLDADTLLVAAERGAGSLTRSGYPREVRRWSRGTLFDDAQLVDAVESDDMMISPIVSCDASGIWPMVLRSKTFWTSELMHVATDGTLHASPLPMHAILYGTLEGRVVAKLQADEDVGPAGTLVAYGIADVLAGHRPKLEVVLTPPTNGANESVSLARSVLYVGRLEQVVGSIVAVRRHGPGDWRSELIDTPSNSSVFLAGTEASSDRLLYIAVGMTRPQTLHLYEPSRATRAIAAAPERFDPERFVVTQRFAISADGTRVPYFLVLPREVSGPVPVLLYSYGGFRMSLVPGYVGPIAQFMLENGFGYAVANIRGGGEFGPAWHAAALRQYRQRAFDDFHAVAENLHATNVASALGIHGGSNGGLLVGVAYTQRPELYDAVVMAVPLADMRRYHKLLAGASWMDEYGNPDDADDWRFIRQYSPYQNLRADADYPPVMFQTSTKDDRVHPGHARKMAARMDALGHDFDYYENIDGGHGGSADNGQAAYAAALTATWLRSKLER